MFRNVPTKFTRKDMSESLGRAAEDMQFFINGWYDVEWKPLPSGYMTFRYQPIAVLLPRGYYFDGNGD